MTLGILLLLTLLALSFSSSQLTENQAATNFYYTAKAEEIALGGLESAIAVLRQDSKENPFDSRLPSDRRSSCDHLFERWAIYYDDDDGFACKRSAKDSEAVDLSDYDELAGVNNPWRDKPVLDSRWIKVMARDPVTGQESPRPVGRYAVTIEDENAKVNINTAGNPDPEVAAKNKKWSHRQNMGFSTAEVDLGAILGDRNYGLRALFADVFDDIDINDYPDNVDSRTALDIVAHRYGARTSGRKIVPGREDFDDNRTPSSSGSGRIRRTKLLDLLAQAGNGIDDDGDGLVDEPDEERDEPGEFDAYKPMEIKSPGELIPDPGPKGTTGILGDDTPYLTVSQLKMANSFRETPGLKPPYPRDRLCRALLPYMTVYSQDLNRYSNIDVGIGGGRRGRGGAIEWMMRENIGRWLEMGYNNPASGANEVYESLRWMQRERIAFTSTSDDDILRQIAVNIYDFVDRDWFPTEYGDLVGIESTPYLNEVEPTPRVLMGTELGLSEEVIVEDHGEYIEILNPYDVPLDLANYRVNIDSGSPKRIRNMEVVGDTIIRPRSFFIIGDQLGDVVNIGEGTRSPDQKLRNYPPGCQAYAPLKLGASEEMVLEMETTKGMRLVEESKYSVPATFDNITAQKNDPRIPEWEALAGTPGTINLNLPSPANAYSSFYIPGVRSRAKDPAYTSNLGDLRILDHAGALHTIGELGMVHRAEAWRSLNFTGERQLGYPDSESDDDIRLLDVLTLPHQYRCKMDDRPVARHAIPGRININTASPQVLMGLNWYPFIIQDLRNYYGLRVSPGLRTALIQHIIDRRKEKPYRNLADVAHDITEFMDRIRALKDSPEAAKEAFMRYNSNLITTKSSVFKITVVAQVFDRRGNVAATRKLEAVVDRGYTPGSLNGPDPDDKKPSRLEQARAETARTLYFRWITQD